VIVQQRATDVLAIFNRPGTFNGPTEAISGCREHLRGSVLGFRNLTIYIVRSLLESGGFRPPPTPSTAMSRQRHGHPALRPSRAKSSHAAVRSSEDMTISENKIMLCS
jgi:hypothetical protein